MTNLVDEMAPAYVHRLVVALKDTGRLTTPLLEEAFSHVPRHAFLDYFYSLDMVQRRAVWHLVQAPPVEETRRWLEALYTDDYLVTALNATNMPISSSSAPGIMASMLEALDVHPGMRVLEIGTGTGYNAALLAHIVGDPRLVFTVEIDPEIAHQAQQRLDQVIGTGTTVYAGNGLEGYPPGAPFDRIMVTASSPTIPHPWLDQLRQGGILVMHLAGTIGTGSLLWMKKEGTTRATHGRFLSLSGFMPLRESLHEPPFIISRLLAQSLTHPVVATTPIVKADFDPVLLWNDDFAFALQLEFPHVHLSSMRKHTSDPLTLCLVYAASQGMVAFCPTEQADAWRVEVRGEPHMWENFYGAYQRWIQFGRPPIADYLIDIDDTGKQVVSLAYPAGSALCRWVIS